MSASCPNEAAHTRCPEGYLAWHAWAERKTKTHTQKRCPGCGLWKIWVQATPTQEGGEGK